MTNQPPFAPTGLHPQQIRSLRDHNALSQAEFGQLFGIAAHQVDHWEAEGLSTGPSAVAVRAVAHAWGFELPVIDGGGAACVICSSDGYHAVFGLSVCRSCYLTPRNSMRDIGYVVRVEDEMGDHADLEVKAPPGRAISLPPAAFGPEDWKTAVRKLRIVEHQTGFSDFDDLVFIEYIEDATRERMTDERIRHLIADLVPHGELQLIGDAARLHLFRRNARPLNELVLRLGLLMSLFCDNAG